MKKAKEETIRIFIAIELPEDIQSKLQKLQDDLSSSMPDARWTKPGNIHLTLKFLGDVEVSRIDKISAILKGIAQNFSPFEISLAEIGAFPNSRKPSIIWVGVEKGAQQLVEIAENIESSMEKIGFPKEKRPFRPHLTVGRVRELKHPEAMTKALDESNVGELGVFKANQISLVKSQLDPGGSIYTILNAAIFGKINERR